MDFYLLKTIILGVFIGNLLVYNIVSIAVTLRKMLQECDEKDDETIDKDIFK